jgi:hypothetical protein
MPLLIISYGLQYLDSEYTNAILRLPLTGNRNQSSIQCYSRTQRRFGKLAHYLCNTENTDKTQELVGQQFSWASSVFYIGYLVASYPISLGFVKFPLGKYLSVLMYVIPNTCTCTTLISIL